MTKYNIEIAFNSSNATKALTQLSQQLSKIDSQLKALGVKSSVSNLANGLDRASSSAQKAQKNITKTSQSIRGLASSADFATKALTGLSAYFSVKSITQMADEYTNMQNKIRALSDETTDYVAVQEQLFNVAKESRTEISAITQLYSRLMLAQKSLNASQEQMIEFTEGVAKAMQLSGASAFTQRGVLLQLSQAMGSGTVRAEEFNSILEGGVMIAQIAANNIEGMEGSIAKLRKAVVDGKVDSKTFFDAILNGLNEVNDAWATTTPTIQQSLTILNNEMTKFIGEMSQATGLSSTIAAIIRDLAANFDALVMAITSVVAGFAAFKAAVVIATVATGGFAAALSVVAAHPVGAILLAIGAAYLILRDNVSAATLAIQAETKELETINQLNERGAILSREAAEAKLAQAKAALANAGALQTELNQTRAGLLELQEALLDNPLAQFKDWVIGLYDAEHSISGALEENNDQWEANKERIAAATEAVAAAQALLDRSTASINNQTSATKELTKAQQDLIDKKNKVIENLQYEYDQLGRNELQQQIYNDLRRAGIDISNLEVTSTGQLLGVYDQYAAIIAKLNTDLYKKQQLENSSKGALEQYINKNKNLTKILNGEYDAYDNMVSAILASTQGQEMMMSNFGDLEDALVDFAMTGELSISDFAKTLLENILRMGIQMLIITPIARAFWAAVTMGASEATQEGVQASIQMDSQAFSGWIGSFASGLGGILGFADGGAVVGPGTSTSDSIPARLSNGEYVINADSTSKFYPLLEAINSNRYARGGLVGDIDNISSNFGSRGTQVIVEDRRGANAPAIEEERGTDSFGRETIRLIVREEVNKGYYSGAFDKSLQNNYGLRRSVTRR